MLCAVSRHLPPVGMGRVGFDDELEVGMVLTSESYIGSRDGGEGVKLEDQYLVNEAGPELLTDFPVSLTL